MPTPLESLRLMPSSITGSLHSTSAAILDAPSPAQVFHSLSTQVKSTGPSSSWLHDNMHAEQSIQMGSHRT